MDKKIFSLYDYYKILLNYRKLIIIATLTVVAITLFIVFFVMDPIFYSYSTVKTTVKAGDISSILGGGAISGMDLGELTGGGAAYKELALYENILNSRRCLDEFIIKFNIIEDENFKYMNDALKYVRKNVLELSKDKIAGTMEIGVYDKNPQKAKEMVDFLVSSLNRINTELNVQNAKNNREFIESRYNLARSDLKSYEDTLKLFQDKYGIAPDVQIKAAAQVGVQFEVEIKSEEMKLDMLKKIMSSDQPEIKQQEEKIAVLKSQLNKMRSESDDMSLLAMKGKPEIAINYMRLLRNVELQTKIITFLLPMYEQAKIEEKKETPSVIILDPSFVPDKKVKPARLIITLVAGFLSFLLTFGFAVSREKWRLYKENNN